MRYFTVFILLISSYASAQQNDSIALTRLQEVTVYGMPVSKYAAGTKTEQVKRSDESVLLDNALSSSPSVYFKTYGNSQLSSIAFRGTSASHTAVLWNGMNINSPTLGQTDFSLLPVFLMDDIILQFGTTSSLYGSDALGGSVLINSATPQFKPATQIQVQQDAGSFGSFFSGARLKIAGERWEIRTKAMYRTLENDFPYTSPSVGYKKNQNNAAVDQYGFDQQIHYKISDLRWISFEAMHTHNLREIQPDVTNDQSDETLEDTNTRLSLSYHGSHKAGTVYASTGYVYNDQVFNGDSRTRSDQATALFNIDKSLTSKLSIRYGGSGTLFIVDDDDYSEHVQEMRYDVFVSLHYWLKPSWNLSVNARQSLYDKQYAPFAPSVGTEYSLISEDNKTLLLKFQTSRGYRVPTLNDRYYNPGGNPELKPEDAWNVEGGLEWKIRKDRHRIDASLTAFTTRADQWIIWLPGDAYWAPQNLQKVNASGAELEVKHTLQYGIASLYSGLVYSYTRSKNLEGITSTDKSSVDSQLPYVPYHTARFFSDLHIKGWSASINVAYTGKRYTTLDNEEYQSLEAYALADFSLAKRFDRGKWSFIAGGKVNNLFDVYYENIKSRAMPGINYSLSLVVNFNQTK